MINILTATGARQKAWSICEKLMAAQTYKGEVNWVIVDDGPKPQVVYYEEAGGPDWSLTFLRPRPLWSPGMNTQARNLLAGLEYVDRRYPLVIIEDDDYYAPDYIEFALAQLAGVDLAGETRARYYNIATRRWRHLSNTTHSSLASTVMQGAAIDAFAKACKSGDKFIDIRLWASVRRKRLYEGGRVVGIKGMPGRGGIGIGHREDFGTRDVNDEVLKHWLGDGVRFYGS